MLKRWSILAVIALALAFVGGEQKARAEGEEWVGKRAPDFSMVDVDGKPLKLADFAGKKVVWINFWGLRCGPCVRELPALQKLYSDFQKKGLVIIGVNTDGVDGAFVKKQFAERPDLKGAAVTFPLMPDVDFKVIDAYGLMGAPLNVMIDKKGIIRYRHEGYEDGDEVKYAKVLEKLIAE
ncbi:MAG: TlpA family protein disulfide reductase [Deltaproteobacteria bacterium]|nr:TlpA family protein disulfide reductase [Deltaproteobacteria bacterium]